MLKIYVRKDSKSKWIPLYLIKVVQNEEGKFYAITRYGPNISVRLAKFNDYKPIWPFVPFLKGSHFAYRNQEALDFVVPEGWQFCINKICTVKTRTTTQGSYISVIAGKYEPFFVHTYDWVKRGTWKAMTPLGRVAPRSISKVSPHLHLFALKDGAKYRIRNDILAHQAEDTK